MIGCPYDCCFGRYQMMTKRECSHTIDFRLHPSATYHPIHSCLSISSDCQPSNMAKKGKATPDILSLTSLVQPSLSTHLTKPRPETNTPFNTAKSRTISVRLISTALTGYYRTYVRPRTHRPLSFLKYDPVGMFVACPLPPTPYVTSE